MIKINSMKYPSAGRLFGCSYISVFLYLLLCAVLAVTGHFRPLPTFDRYLYAGAVASLQYSDPIKIHQIARNEIDAQPAPFPLETVKDEPYFEDIWNNPYHFAEQMGLFRFKLGYVTAGYLLWRAGLPIIDGLRLVSACSFFVIGVVLLAWVRSPLLALLLLLISPILNLARTVTADPLSTAVIFSAFFALSLKRPHIAAGLLLASIVIRGDNFVLAFILLAWMFFRRDLELRTTALFAVGATAIAVAIHRFAGLYRWRVLMQHSFIKPEITPISHPVLLSFSGYLHVLAGLRVLPYTFILFWLFIGLAVWKMLPKDSFFRSAFAVIGLFMIVRIFSFPNMDDRFYVWIYLIIGTALIQLSQNIAPPLYKHSSEF